MCAIIAMKEKHIQLLGVIFSAIFFALIVWLYLNEPKTLTEVATKASVTAGVYEIDKVKFDEGLSAFRQNNFVAARDNFQKADAEQKDAQTQFYIAYSFYRQGWGKIYNDRELFRQGLEAAGRAAALDSNFKTSDADLKLKTPAELRSELEQGLQITVEDFNPLKVLRERK